MCTYMYVYVEVSYSLYTVEIKRDEEPNMYLRKAYFSVELERRDLEECKKGERGPPPPPLSFPPRWTQT